MPISLEIRPVVTEIVINNTNTSLELSGGIPPLQWGTMLGDLSNQTDLSDALDDKLDKTDNIQALEAVSSLPGTPDPNTIYFIT